VLIFKYICHLIMLKYFVIRNFRGACSSAEIMKGYMLICWNAEGVHGQRKVGHPWSTTSKESACRIMCTRTPENEDMARGFSPLPFQKRGNGEEVPFHHRCRRRQIFGMRRILPEFPQTCPKRFCATFAYKFSPARILKTSFWCNLQKKVFMCF